MIHPDKGLQFAVHAPAGHYVAIRVGFAFPLSEVNGLPEDWVGTYTREGFMVDDPIMRWAYHNSGTIRWSDLAAQDSHGILARAADHGMAFGAAVSCSDDALGLRSFGIFARDDRELADHEIANLERRVCFLHETSSPPARLTAAEVEALSLVKEGLFLKEIASQLGVSEGAIKQRLRNARQKLQARTGSHAVSIAVAARLI